MPLRFEGDDIETGHNAASVVLYPKKIRRTDPYMMAKISVCARPLRHGTLSGHVALEEMGHVSRTYTTELLLRCCSNIKRDEPILEPLKNTCK